MQNLKTVVLLAAISGLLIAVGGAVGGTVGVVVALGFAVAMNFGSYWFSADIVLRSSRAQELEPADDPALFRIVGDLATQAGMPMPRVYRIPGQQPNAFATGRSPRHAAVAVTEGIRVLLTERELRGVLGHELAHVRNRDILTSSIVATIGAAISALSFFALWFGGRRDNAGGLLAALLAPLVATLIQLGISRSREYQADRDGAHLTDDPQALASALLKIEAWAQRTPPLDVPQATAHLYISNPLRGGAAGLFATHPPTASRVERLQQMTEHRPDGRLV